MYRPQFPVESGSIESGFGAASRDHAFCANGNIGRLIGVRSFPRFLGCSLIAGRGNSRCSLCRTGHLDAWSKFRSTESADHAAEPTTSFGNESHASGRKACAFGTKSDAIGAVARASHQESRDSACSEAETRSSVPHYSPSNSSARTRRLSHNGAAGGGRAANGEGHRFRATKSAR